MNRDIETAKTLRKECCFAESAAAAQKAVAAARDDLSKAESLYAYAFATYCLNQLDESRAALERAMLIAERIRSEEVRGKTARMLGALQWVQGHYSEAISNIRVAWSIAKEQKDEELLCLAGVSIGSILGYMGEYEESIQHLSAAAQLAEKCRDWHQLALAHTNLGVAYCSLGDSDRGLAHHLKTQEIYAKYPDPQHVALCKMNIALTYAEMENYERALEYNTRALESLPPGSRTLIAAAIHSNAGQALFWLNRLEESFEMLDMALREYNEAHFTPGKAELLPYLGCCLIRMGRQGEGNTLCNKGLILSDESGRKDLQLSAKLLAGYGFFLLGDFKTARAHLDSAHAMAQSNGIKRFEKYARQFLDQLPPQSSALK